MPKNRILTALFLCALVGIEVVHGEETVSLDMATLLGRIASENAEVKASRSRLAAAEEGVAVAKSARLPQINASLDLNYIGDGTILDRDFTNAMRDKLPHFGNTLNVSVYQPVYTGGAITSGIKLAEQQTELAAVGLAQQQDASATQAVAAYFNLMKMHNLRQVYVDNIGITEQLIEQMRERVSQGTALKNDITRYELRLSSLKYDLQSIDNTLSVLNHDLTTLLGYADGTRIEPAGQGDGLPALDGEDYWQELTRRSSHELSAIDKSRELAKTSLRLEKAALYPTVGIVAVDNLSGPVTFEIPALNKNYNAWFAGVNISYNLSSLYTAPKKIRQKQTELLHVDDQRTAMGDALSRRVHAAYTEMTQARQLLATEELNVRLANENYDVVETRFHNDMALLTDMLDASTAKLDSETRLVNARINVWLSYYQLRYISGTLMK